MSQEYVVVSQIEAGKVEVREEVWNIMYGDCLEYTKVVFTGNADEVQGYLQENNIEEVIVKGLITTEQEMSKSTVEKMNKNKQEQDRLIAADGEISVIEQLSKEWQQMFDTLSPQEQSDVSGLPVLKSGIRYLPVDKVQAWKQLNKRHNEINRFFDQVYGGPDVNESYFETRLPEVAQESRELYAERDEIMVKKQALEAEMTEEEFEATL